MEQPAVVLLGVPGRTTYAEIPAWCLLTIPFGGDRPAAGTPTDHSALSPPYGRERQTRPGRSTVDFSLRLDRSDVVIVEILMNVRLLDAVAVAHLHGL